MSNNIIDFSKYLTKKREKALIDAVKNLDFSTCRREGVNSRDGQQMIEKLTSVIAACETHIAFSAGVN